MLVKLEDFESKNFLSFAFSVWARGRKRPGKICTGHSLAEIRSTAVRGKPKIGRLLLAPKELPEITFKLYAATGGALRVLIYTSLHVLIYQLKRHF